MVSTWAVCPVRTGAGTSMANGVVIDAGGQAAQLGQRRYEGDICTATPDILRDGGAFDEMPGDVGRWLRPRRVLLHRRSWNRAKVVGSSSPETCSATTAPPRPVWPGSASLAGRRSRRVPQVAGAVDKSSRSAKDGADREGLDGEGCGPAVPGSSPQRSRSCLAPHTRSRAVKRSSLERTPAPINPIQARPRPHAEHRDRSTSDCVERCSRFGLRVVG